MSEPKQKTGDQYWAGDVTIKDQRGRPLKIGPEMVQTADGLECKIPGAAEAAYRESLMRPLLADEAFIDVMAVVDKLMGNPTPEDANKLFDCIRERMRQLAAQSAITARAALAMVQRAEHGSARQKVDPGEVVREILELRERKMTLADAYAEIALACGVSDTTIRNVWLKHKPRRPK